MTQVTTQDLENAKLDCATIAAVATSTEETVEDRLGNEKRTLTGALLALGYEAPVAYTTGLSMTSGAQTVEHSGIVYAAKPSDVPFTTTGTWGSDSSKFLLLDSSTATQQATAAAVSAAAAAASLAAATGRLIDIQVFTSTGTWTKPANLSFAIIDAWGAGAGGAGAKGASGQLSVGGSGGSGAFIRTKVLAANLDNGADVTIGAEGAGGSTTPTDGSDGGNSLFEINGGAGSIRARGGFHGAYIAAGTSVVGERGNSSLDCDITGTATGATILLTKPSSPAGLAQRLSGTLGIAAQGGSSEVGFGGPAPNLNGTTGKNGYEAGGYASGGSGAISADATGYSGGPGTAGLIVVYSYS